MSPAHSKETVPSNASASWATQTGNASTTRDDDPSPKPRCIESKQHSDQAYAPVSGPTNRRKPYCVLTSSTPGALQNESSVVDRAI
jgi:hypothetical protein